jgi:gliding motility-associated-like protein
MKNKITIIFLSVLLNTGMNCQTVTPHVINSAGMAYPVPVNGVYLVDNIGEPFTKTLGPTNNFIITEGFLQPELVSKIGPTITVIKNDVSCADKKDGNISVSVSNVQAGSQVVYIWSGTLCPANNCSRMDSLIAGSYSVTVIITRTTTSGMVIDSLKAGPIAIKDENGPCKIKIFNAVTPNGDNINDVWQIDNIDEFPKNRVMIFNRWGTKLTEITGYDNITKFWPSKDDINKLDPSTYFYIIDLGEGGKPLKGWVELIKN